VPRNKEEHGKNSARESTNEYRILNAKPVSPEFLATSICEPAVKLTKISPKGTLDRNTRIVSFLNMPSSFHAKWQGGGG
jgi:hypothetical protein